MSRGSSSSLTLPPGPAWSPPSTTLRWLLRPIPVMETCRTRYGDSFTLRFMHEGVTVLISHPEDVRRLFTAHPSAVHAGENRRLVRPIFGDNSLACLDEDAHAAQRRLLLPPVHGDRLRAHAALMTEIARAEVATWKLGEPIEMASHLRDIAFEIILRAVFGIRDATRAAPLRRAISRLFDFTASVVRMTPMMLLGPDNAQRIPLVRRMLQAVDEVIHQEIARRRREPDLDTRSDILSMLLTTEHGDGAPMTANEIRDELVTMLIGGHESTAATLAWAIEQLARSPAMMDRIRSEAHNGDETYLDAFVKETLRARSVLAVVSRLVKTPLQLRDHTISPGTIVAACIYLVHHRSDVYPEPYAFRPERFLESSPGTYTWLPFGGGVRRCVGSGFAMLEMKTVIRVASEQLRMKPARRNPEAVGRRAAVMMVPKNGCRVICEPVGRP
jgi:cytochrome P450 family 135